MRSAHVVLRRVWLLGALVGLPLAGCEGVIDDPSGSTDPNAPRRPGGNTTPLRCEGEPLVPASAPTRRLTAAEYRASVASIFPGVAMPELRLLANANPEGFDNDVRGQAVSELLVESYRDAAVAIAAAAVANRTWMPCETDDDACRSRIATQLASRVYRRAPTADETTRLAAFLAAQSPEYGLVGAVEMLVEALLQSPTFLYKPELGDPGRDAPEGLVALSDHELATRLAYFLEGGPPSEALLARAADLRTPEGLEAEARTMLESPAAREAVATFHDEWLRLRRLEEVGLDAELFPEWGNETSRDLRDSLAAYLAFAFWEDGSVEGLLTSRRAYVNDRLAPIFGVPAPGSDELVPVELSATERAGLMTQPGLLASTSHGLSHSPILRGVLVLDALLCTPPPPPPPSVDPTIPSTREDGTPIRTVRERVELTHGSAECASCHEAIDGMGFSFERYDAIGRFRTEENDATVDPTGVLRGETVEDGVALAEALAADREVHRCLATQWYRFALGRREEGADTCQIEDLTDRLEATDGDLRELVVALVTSNAFRFRPL
ncbi:MAG: DUF1592 domain-containing protein [Sandaracinus sp.]|nr:DUF1592 domain-containing protein [Sandaracinus sp.]MCB9613083.1 DUF1592 domain-containing protein [Sandaracinus sp.]MCB9624632.1 DUF1592 domain-containing protein [Sandaracinus sp.]